MLTAAQNQRITQVGPGTPMGETLRRYWLPALLTYELEENDGPPLRVRLLGEELIAFRDTNGDVGLVSAYCPHRRAPMFFGRNEACGLRCVYHGWKFDRSGACADMPSEPPDSPFKTKVRIEAYPTWEGGGIVWTYMGPTDSAPPPPNYELVRVPATHRCTSKTFEDCNYLQALEGGIDPGHSNVLHHKGSDVEFLRSYERIFPAIDVYKTDYGFVHSGIRPHNDKQWVRLSHYIMPAMNMRATVQPMSGRPPHPTMDGHFWVPIDDTHTWVFNYMYSYFPDAPLSPEYATMIEEYNGHGANDVGPDYRLTRNKSNDYLIDRPSQKNGSFTGIDGVNTQDFALQEGMGAVVDRTKEHLGTTDKTIIAIRQLLLEATHDVAGGRRPRGADPSQQEVRAADHFIPQGANWQDVLVEKLQALY